MKFFACTLLLLMLSIQLAVHACTLIIPDGTAAVTSELVTSLVGDNEEITGVLIPYTTTSIKDNAFEGCPNLKSIIIPGSVASIGKGAFKGCSNLTQVTLEKGLVSIGENAFIGCVNLKGINIPATVTSIGAAAFSGCRGLTEIDIPDRVATIGREAFSGCTDLLRIRIPGSVTSIGLRAFHGCTGLTELTIPGSVREIFCDAFGECRNLGHVTWDVNRELMFYDECGDGAGTPVDLANPFTGCSEITRVDFLNGLPSAQVIFGNSNPTVYTNSLTYNGCNLVYGEIERKFELPANTGEAGQFLMTTSEGVQWESPADIQLEVVADSFQLRSGWNIIVLPDAELPESCRTELLRGFEFYGYDAERQELARAAELLPRGCYWVNVREECTIHFSRAFRSPEE